MKDTQYRALLDYRMCGDGAHHFVNMEEVDGLMNHEARERGFDNWIVAYHEWNPNPEAPKDSPAEGDRNG